MAEGQGTQLSTGRRPALLSAFLPGAGQWALGHRVRAAAFVTLWIAFLGLPVAKLSAEFMAILNAPLPCAPADGFLACLGTVAKLTWDASARTVGLCIAGILLMHVIPALDAWISTRRLNRSAP